MVGQGEFDDTTELSGCDGGKWHKKLGQPGDTSRNRPASQYPRSLNIEIERGGYRGQVSYYAVDTIPRGQ